MDELRRASWSEMDIFDLKNELDRGRTRAETASFRSGMRIDEVRAPRVLSRVIRPPRIWGTADISQ